jgi:hypothetical protein
VKEGFDEWPLGAAMKDAKELAGALMLILGRASERLTIATTELRKLPPSEDVKAIRVDVAKALEIVDDAVQQAAAFIENVDRGPPQLD